MFCVTILIRVEGQGSATILDVIYSTKQEKTEEDSNKIESENIHKSLVQQIKEKDKEIKHLEFRQTAIEKQKELLGRYSKQVIEIEQELKKVRIHNKYIVTELYCVLVTMCLVSCLIVLHYYYYRTVHLIHSHLLSILILCLLYWSL